MADISSIKLPNNSMYNIKAKKIYYAECGTASTDIAKVVACDGFVLEKGAIIAIRFTYIGTTYPKSGNISLNINGTGAKNIVPKGSNTILTYNWSWAFRANQTWIFVYDGTYFAWLNQDNNTTYNPMTLGFGYGTCTTAEATAAKVATLASYALVKNGIVSIKFTYAVPANATLNINKRGAKAIYYRGTKITADVIDKGDIATFVYDGANYQLLTVDSNNPSTRIDLTGKTIDLNDLTLADGVSHIKKYIEKTAAGAAKISNLPAKLANQPFVLDVELIRFGTANTDYITTQTIKGVGEMAVEYYRWCVNGTWQAWTRRVFTDTTITVDASLSSTSTNPVQNKVINTALANKANSSHTHTISDITDLSEQISNIELLFDGIATQTSPAQINNLDDYKIIVIELTLSISGSNIESKDIGSLAISPKTLTLYHPGTSFYYIYSTNWSRKIYYKKNTSSQITFYAGTDIANGYAPLKIWGIK